MEPGSRWHSLSECLILIYKCLRNTYVPNTISGSGINTEVSTESLCLHGAYILEGGDKQ